MAAKDIVKYRFKKGVSGNPKGRPRKLLSVVIEQLKKNGYSIATKNEIYEAYCILINLPLQEVKNIAQGTDGNTEYPIIIRLVAKELLGSRGADYLERIMDRVFGKPQQAIEHNVSDDYQPPIINIVNSK
jgi:hypothetical protein